MDECLPAEGGDRAGAAAEQIVGGFDRASTAWVLALGGGAGIALGVSLPWLSGLAAELPWMPFQGPIRLLGSFDHPWSRWGAAALGLAAGLAFATWAILNSPVLHIGRDQVLVRRYGQVVRVIDRAKVDAVYRNRSTLVIETGTGRKLFDDEVEGDKAIVRDAFVSHGYPWEGG